MTAAREVSFAGPGDGMAPFPPELRRVLADIAGRPQSDVLRPGDGQKLNSSVFRLRLETASGERSVIAKRLAPEIARRNQLVAERWLPALGMQASGPVLLATAAELDGASVWHVYEDHGDHGLGGRSPDPEHVRAAVRAIAEIHRRFAEHPILGECRLWGGDLGTTFYRASVQDATRALEAIPGAPVEVSEANAALLDRLLKRLKRLQHEFAELEWVSDCGGPETLLHGDLWTKNVLVTPAPALAPGGDGGRSRRFEVRLIDWDHAAVGLVSYDLSTFLYRFPAEERPAILDIYREAIQDSGWEVPAGESFDRLCETAEAARIANRLIWPALSLLDGDDSWGFEALKEVETWFRQLRLLLS